MLRRILKKIVPQSFLKNRWSHPVIFDKRTDLMLSEIGREARKKLESYPLNSRKRILYFPSYYQSKFLALNDATIIAALQIRGAEVIPVLSGFFYQKEDVIYGGIYNKERLSNQIEYARKENFLLTSLLHTEPISVTSFSSAQSETTARKIAQNITIDSIHSSKYKNIYIGELAEKAVLNMNAIPRIENTKELVQQLRWHIYNIVRLIDSVENIFSIASPDVVVSNTPFYYKWNIPFNISQSIGKNFYSFVIGERLNSFAWARNSKEFYDVKSSWMSYYESGLFKKYEDIIDSDIADRMSGKVTHINFLKTAFKNGQKVLKLREKIDSRPAILFPVNILVDAAVFVSGMAFCSCLEMIRSVVDFFSHNQQYVCIMKAHPAERLWCIAGESYQLHNILRKEDIKLPDNIIFLDYDTDFASFDLYGLVNGLIAYSSSTCMEFGWTGKQSISIYGSHYTCANFTIIPNSEKDFFETLQNVLSNDVDQARSSEIIERARAYYFLYNHITQIDMKLFVGNDLETVPTRALYSSVDDLAEGKNESLDYICNAIIQEKPIFGKNVWPPVTI